MATPNHEAIQTFVSITGASEAIAEQNLEHHGGDLNAAVNSYFSEGDRRAPPNAPTTASATQDDFMDVEDNPVEVEAWRPPPTHLSTSGVPNPFSLLDPNFRRSLFDPTSDLMSAEHFSRPRAVRRIPVEVEDSSGPSTAAPIIDDVTDQGHSDGSNIHRAVVIDDDDDDELPSGSLNHSGQTGDRFPHDAPRNQFVGPAGPRPDNLQDNDVEEQMIRAAIEASKKEVEESFPNQPFNVDNDVNDPRHRRIDHQIQSQLEDPELARAVSLSLKMAEQEKVLRDQELSAGESSGLVKSAVAEPDNVVATNGRLEAGTASIPDEVEDLDKQPLVRHRSRRRPSGGSLESANDVQVIEESPPSSPRPLSPGLPNASSSTERNVDAFHSEDWGGLSSLEHDEAVMLEAAMFGGIPEGSDYRFPYGPHQMIPPGMGRFPRPMPRPPSPSLTAQRLIREQQDDEYLASLQADREKEQKAKEEAEARLEEERRMEEESRMKLEEEKEQERLLAEKEATLPQEPALDDENAVNLLVRMPNGSRHGRRFRKSDKLQCLFDFIDVGRVVKPGSYRLVRPYPKRAFQESESASTLNELGLTGKQEALFLELI